MLAEMRASAKVEARAGMLDDGASCVPGSISRKHDEPNGGGDELSGAPSDARQIGERFQKA